MIKLPRAVPITSCGPLFDQLSQVGSLELISNMSNLFSACLQSITVSSRDPPKKKCPAQKCPVENPGYDWYDVNLPFWSLSIHAETIRKTVRTISKEEECHLVSLLRIFGWFSPLYFPIFLAKYEATNQAFNIIQRSSPLSAAKWLRSLHPYPIPIASLWPWISTSPLPPVPRGDQTRRDFGSLHQWRPRNCHWVAMQRAPGGAQKALQDLQGLKQFLVINHAGPCKNMTVSKTQEP